MFPAWWSDLFKPCGYQFLHTGMNCAYKFHDSHHSLRASSALICCLLASSGCKPKVYETLIPYPKYIPVNYYRQVTLHHLESSSLPTTPRAHSSSHLPHTIILFILSHESVEQSQCRTSDSIQSAERHNTAMHNRPQLSECSQCHRDINSCFV